MKLNPPITTILAIVVALAGCSGAPPHFDGALRTSSGGAFSASVKSDPAMPPVNVMHSWVFHLETDDGRPVENARITVDGDMPDHGHGLPTQPLVTEYLGEGDYLVEGMQFQMGGDWYVEFSVAVDGTEDTIRFEFRL
jgi:hypothetical protein